MFSPTLSEAQLCATENDGLTLEALHYKSGYLTIEWTALRGRAYRLGIPNREVGEGITEDLLPLASRRRTAETTGINFSSEKRNIDSWITERV